MSSNARTFRSASRFVLRTPTLPFDVLAAWSDDPDRRAALRRLVDDPAVREALYVASPELDGQIAAWQRDPETPGGVAVERALVRYVSRMASRSTPFGLFASVAVGAVAQGDEPTRLAIAPRAEAQRRTRLDNDLLFALCADLARDRAVRVHLRYRPNSSLYLAAARLRYAEARLQGPVRTYHLVAVDPSEHLDALLARASAGATPGELAAVLCADPEIARDEADAFVHEVIDAQILVPELAPNVTGSEPTDGMIASLESQGLPQYAAPLRAAQTALREIDAAAPGVPAAAYRAIEKLLADGVPTKVEANRLFQVDLFKPAPAATLSAAVTAELIRGVELLHALAPPPGEDAWSRFRTRFAARYESREVPLNEVLDEESGIGFGDHDTAPRAAPLLADLALGMRGGGRTVAVGLRDAHLMRLVAGALRTGATEIELSDRDVELLSHAARAPLPDVVSAHAHIIAESAEAIAEGRYRLRVNSAGGGANLLGRFCHGSADVAALTADCLRAEEAARPGAIFAEVVHLPEGRVGNVLLRPQLRDHEIPFLGTSGADPERQIALEDLLVSVVGDRVVLRSRRLGCEIVPRLTSAHNYTSRSLVVYRFLCSHAQQGAGMAYWTWGLLDEMPFLPRIRRGKFILERARWALGPGDLEPLEAAFAGSNAAKTPAQLAAIRARAAAVIAELRARLQLPRWIVIGDGDNELPVDLDNDLMVDSAAHLLKSRRGAVLYELLPGPGELCARGPEGAFSHELIALLLAGAPARTAPVLAAAAPEAAAEPRRFLPGSRWLYLKLYSGTATADALLRDYVAPAIREVQARGLADGWFFIRYADPDPHVRLRFTGDPRRLTGELLPFLHEVLAPAVERGLLWKIAVDTYEREVERYGGLAAIGAAEALFCADSDAALAIIESCEGDAGADAAWRVTLRGIDRLMDDLGLSLAEKLATMTAARDGFGAEFGMDTALQKRLGEKYRTHRAEIAALLDAPDDDSEHPFGPALQLFAERSRKLRPIAARLRALAAAGQLTLPITELAHSYIHMHVNRMIRSAQRVHELVLYDLLRRHYDGVVARSKQRPKSEALAKTA